jgi:hypothetical protein
MAVNPAQSTSYASQTGSVSTDSNNLSDTAETIPPSGMTMDELARYQNLTACQRFTSGPCVFVASKEPFPAAAVIDLAAVSKTPPTIKFEGDFRTALVAHQTWFKEIRIAGRPIPSVEAWALFETEPSKVIAAYIGTKGSEKGTVEGWEQLITGLRRSDYISGGTGAQAYYFRAEKAPAGFQDVCGKSQLHFIRSNQGVDNPGEGDWVARFYSNNVALSGPEKAAIAPEGVTCADVELKDDYAVFYTFKDGDKTYTAVALGQSLQIRGVDSGRMKSAEVDYLRKNKQSTIAFFNNLRERLGLSGKVQ